MRSLKKRFLLPIVALIMIFALSGCLDLFSIPNVSVSSDGQWVAVLLSSGALAESELDASLTIVNVNDGSQVIIGVEGDQQLAYDWHPTTLEIAYYNISIDGVGTIRVSSVDDPVGVDMIGTSAFPSNFWVTQLAYSPDGTRLAMSVVLLPEGVSLNSDDSLEDFDDIRAALYVANLTDGTVAGITTPGELYPSSLDWSPDSNQIAFTAWNDGDGDGNIDISGEGISLAAMGVGDIPGIYVADLGAGSVSNVTGDAVAWSPSWVNDNQLLAVSATLDMATGSGSADIVSVDVTSQQSTVLVAGSEDSLALSVAAAPDGSSFAYTLLPESPDSALGGDDETIPSEVRLANIDGSGVTTLYVNDTAAGLADVPVWSADGSTIFVSSANPVSSLAGLSATLDMSLPQQQVVAVDVNNPGESNVVFEGPMTSSGLLQFALITAASFAEGFE